MRNYAADDPDVADRWRSAIRSGEPRIAAKDLYKGGYWSAVRAAAEVIGWSAVSIVSAGLGLIRPDDEVSAYSATFSAGHADSIPGAGDPTASGTWWTGLGGEACLDHLIEREKPDAFVCALPASYLRPLEGVLEKVSARFSPTRVAILGAPKSSTLKAFAVPLDARAVRRVGGAAGQVAARVLAWIAESGTLNGPWEVQAIQSAVKQLVCEDDPGLYPRRKPMTDGEVRAWISACVDSSAPPTSASTALRSLRVSGCACEEKRFRALFKEVSADRVSAGPQPRSLVEG